MVDQFIGGILMIKIFGMMSLLLVAAYPIILKAVREGIQRGTGIMELILLLSIMMGKYLDMGMLKLVMNLML